MPTGISRELIQRYFQAALSRDPARIGPFLHEDVRWSCSGPVDLLPYCGQRQGKSAVIDTIVRLAPTAIRLTGMEIQELLIDGDCAATFSRLIAVRAGTGRTISFRCAQFFRFREDKLVEFRAVIDSFDAAEQVLGHRIEVAPGDVEPAKNVFAI